MRPKVVAYGDRCSTHAASIVRSLLREAIAKRLFEIEPYNPRELCDALKHLCKCRGCGTLLVEVSSFSNFDEYKKVCNKLREAMEEVGYVTNTDVVLHDVNEETKAMWVCGHDERFSNCFFSLIYTGCWNAN
ncbi:PENTATRICOPEPTIDE REPEAT-CONTAINING PROTEIN [Salix viminalis]|uniref:PENTATRICOPEPTIDE REPEAT-CONTAINING PROTEIN n=1 Tax=Salix viminalis TaxID=40686 RepID=A0A9Q0SNS5_SALVM|nr:PENTATRICOPEPTIDE REPEAT-CONTAINING PROTEIN [Salix viminalis]